MWYAHTIEYYSVLQKRQTSAQTKILQHGLNIEARHKKTNVVRIYVHTRVVKLIERKTNGSFWKKRRLFDGCRSSVLQDKEVADLLYTPGNVQLYI